MDVVAYGAVDEEDRDGAFMSEADEPARQIGLGEFEAGKEDGDSCYQRSDVAVDFAGERRFKQGQYYAGKDEALRTANARWLFSDAPAQQEKGQAGEQEVAAVIPRQIEPFVERYACDKQHWDRTYAEAERTGFEHQHE